MSKLAISHLQHFSIELNVSSFHMPHEPIHNTDKKNLDFFYRDAKKQLTIKSARPDAELQSFLGPLF